MPTPSGVVTLCKNALIPRDYTHTIGFKDPNEQLTYWGLLAKYRIENVPYVRRQRQYIVVDYSMEELQDVNYLYFKSLEDSKIYYCHVVDKEYNNPKTTYIYFEVDPLQTFMFDYEIKPSYVIQEHVDRWNADHQPIYSKTDEGLNYGSEYTVESAYAVRDDSMYRWYVAICTDHEELVESGDSSKNNTIINGQNHPYVLYLLPSRGMSITADRVFNFRTGVGNESYTVGGIITFTEEMGKSALGVSVIQIIKLPYLLFDIAVGDTSISNTNLNNQYSVTKIGANNYIKIKNVSIIPKKLAEMDRYAGIDSAMPTDEQWADIKANPYNTERDKRYESKLLCYPYRYNLLTDWKSQPQIIKNEYLAGDKLQVNLTQGISVNSPNRYWIDGYKKDPEGRQTALMQLVPEEQPVINDKYHEYMLTNRNQIQANQTNAITSAVANTGSSVIGGLMGGWAGALVGLGTGAIGGAINYQNMMRSENAKQQDLKNYPDSIINSNDGLFNVLDGNEFITLYRMKICCEFEEMLADTFNITGYTVKRVKKPNTRTRLRFNYIKTLGANIVGSFDYNYLNMIKSIYDNGLTIWHYNTTNFKMYDYSLENIERSLL